MAGHSPHPVKGLNYDSRHLKPDGSQRVQPGELNPGPETSRFVGGLSVTWYAC